MEENEFPKLSKSILNIPGTKASVQSGQLLISSGIPSLDELLGGGLPVGTVVLLEEDQHGTYSKIMLKYFLAEGVVCKHSLFVASQDVSTNSIIKELPAATGSDPDPSSKVASYDEKMKIAFRYQNTPAVEKQTSLEFGHYYDLTKTLPQDIINSTDIFHWSIPEGKTAPYTFLNSAYHHLLESIKDQIKSGKFDIKDKADKRSILRVSIHALGSPMWLPNDTFRYKKRNRDLDMFIFCLRGLMRSAFAVAFVTVPSYLIEKQSVERSIHSSDIALRLQAFAGTELENNPVLSDYHGYFHVIKMAAINSFASKHPGSVEYTFKLRLKKFYIEKLHLPPDLSENKDDEVPRMGCGSSNKYLLEF